MGLTKELKDFTFLGLADAIMEGRISATTMVICPRCHGGNLQKHYHSERCWRNVTVLGDCAHELVCKLTKEACECCEGTGEIPFSRIQLRVSVHEEAPYTSREMYEAYIKRQEEGEEVLREIQRKLALKPR